jgi:glycosyltransferase involved in cell wall biosynthesis
MTQLSLILPVHNEAGNIQKSLADIGLALKSLTLRYEVICVENGSTDDSYDVLGKLAKKHRELHVIRSEIGWGNAVRAGIAHARGKYTCYMVSDGQIDPKVITQLYRRRNEQALVKIWRTSRENPARLTNSRLYNVLARLLFGIDSKDINATPKLADTALLRTIPLRSDNIALDLELMLGIKKRGLGWLEIPAPSKKREAGTSTTKLKSVWEMLRWMVRFRLE